MKACIFTIYYENGKECDHNFECADCECRKEIQRLVEIILKEGDDDE